MKKLGLSLAEILDFIPQQSPFRFIDEISFVDETHIVGHYTFRADEHFYSGHFPKKPITPGVILLETMGQIGLVAFRFYLHSLAVDRSELNHWLTLFTDAEVEFLRPVFPGDKVIVKGQKIIWRRLKSQFKLKTKVDMFDLDENLLTTAVISGVGIRES